MASKPTYEELEQRVKALETQVPEAKRAQKMLEDAQNIHKLLTSDMGMPKMPGERLARELIEIRPDIPVIICTGYSDLIDEDRAKEMGIRGFTMKPFRMKD